VAHHLSDVGDLEPASEVLVLQDSERTFVGHIAGLARQPPGLSVLALVTSDGEIDEGIRKVRDAHVEPSSLALAFDVVDVVHVDVLVVAAYVFSRGGELSDST
jgi:hypothetical protein